MTITSTTSRVDYTGNGVTTAFPVPFAFFGAGELTVIQRVIATGVETTLALSTHYTVSGGNGSTGTVTAVTAPAATVQWTILRSTARTQEVDYQSNDPFPADTHERALDRITAIVQEVERDAARAVRVAPTDTGTVTLPSSVARAGLYLAFDGAGAPIAAAGTAGPPTSPYIATLLDDADAAAARATLGLGSAATLAATATGSALVTAADLAAAQSALSMSWSLCEPPRVVTSVAQVDFALPTAFRRFRLSFHDATVTTAGQQFRARFSSDGGATFLSTANYVSHGLYQINVVGMFNNISPTSIDLTATFSTDARAIGTVEIFPGSSTAKATLISNWRGVESSVPVHSVGQYGGLWDGASARMNALRIFAASGNVTGTFILEGLR